MEIKIEKKTVRAEGMMIDMNETRYFDLGEQRWMNYLLEVVTGMDQL